MVLELEKRLADRLRAVLKEKYALDDVNIPMETPPDLHLGEIATPIALQLARTLRKAPKIIAQEILSGLGQVKGFARFEVAGAGYINAFLDRAEAAQMVARADGPSPPHAVGHVLVEHTSINPNKAAHIGHLRNAILGDTFVRLLRAAGYKVDVQNYIDNTGVQVADVVVGFLHLEKMSADQVRQLIVKLDVDFRAALTSGMSVSEAAKSVGMPVDYYCWQLYARVNDWYLANVDEHGFPSSFETNPKVAAERKQIRLDTLHLIEHGNNETAEIADLISIAVLRRHLETMLRLGIEYDFLPRESEILHLKFWEAAFEKLKQTGVLYFENEGKNIGCWVMTRPGAPSEHVQNEDGSKGTDDDAKVIVRSNGTVTYVGKDIAYHLWKFGLLGRDFGYNPFFKYPDHECWISAVHGRENHPQFGGATAIYNVIDARQSDPQANVIQALRGMGYTDQADHYTHFSYEMVALTPRCAEELGYSISDEDKKKSYIEVSGRKGFGVKADDLIDKLIASVQPLVDEKQASSPEPVRREIARQIAIGALRYFMLKVTRNSVIAFDFKDALSFEGETGRTFNTRSCAFVIFSAKAERARKRRFRNLQHKRVSKSASQQVGKGRRRAVSRLSSAAKTTRTSGRCGCAPGGFRRFSISASRLRNPPISPSTPSSSHRSSRTSTIATTSSRKRTPRAKHFFSPQQRLHCANLFALSPCSASKARKRCKNSF